MVMKIGGEAKSDLIFPKHVEKFARDAGRGAAPTVACVSAIVETVLEAIPSVENPGPVSKEVAALIAERADSFRGRFRKN